MLATLTFWAINKTIGLRASREEELTGLDLPEHGVEAYPAELPALAGASGPPVVYRDVTRP